MPYSYKVIEGEVYVTPIVYVCEVCGFQTESRGEEAQHYYGVGHFLKTTIDSKRMEKWNEERHGPLPSFVKVP